MKRTNTYLTFDGNCAQAMKFYQKCLGGQLQMLPFSEMPGEAPKSAKDRIMHAKLTNEGSIWMASDTMPGMPFKQGNNFSISIECDSVQELDRLFAALSDGGKATMPPQQTFWAQRFGMLTDRFGVNWMLDVEKA